MALILPRNYHRITAVERNRISWIEPEQAERQDIRPLRIGILNIMPLGKQYEFNLLHPLGLSRFFKLNRSGFASNRMRTEAGIKPISTSTM